MELKWEIDAKQIERLRRKSPRFLQKVTHQLGLAVEREAIKAIRPGGGLTAQKTGNLIHSIGTRLIKRGVNPVAIVYATAPYAKWVHEGTGIYGPRKKPIVAIRGKALRFVIDGQVIYRRSVKGFRGRKFFKYGIKRVYPRQLKRIFRKTVGEELKIKRIR